METTIYTTILSHIRTTAELDTVLQKIDKLLESLYRVNRTGFAEVFRGELSADISRAIEETIERQRINPANPEEMKQFLTALKELLQKATVLTMTIAFSPSSESLNLFSAKAKELFGITTVLELRIQEAVTGGAIIIYKGRYLDYSLAAQVKHVFEKHSNDIDLVLKGGSTP